MAARLDGLEAVHAGQEVLDLGGEVLDRRGVGLHLVDPLLQLLELLHRLGVAAVGPVGGVLVDRAGLGLRLEGVYPALELLQVVVGLVVAREDQGEGQEGEGAHVELLVGSAAAIGRPAMAGPR